MAICTHFVNPDSEVAAKLHVAISMILSCYLTKEKTISDMITESGPDVT